MAETITAASEEATDCSAKATSPLPHASRRKPVAAEAPHCARVGQAAPRAFSTQSISPPARLKRTAPIHSGGKPSSAQRMTR